MAANTGSTAFPAVSRTQLRKLRARSAPGLLDLREPYGNASLDLDGRALRISSIVSLRTETFDWICSG